MSCSLDAYTLPFLRLDFGPSECLSPSRYLFCVRFFASSLCVMCLSRRPMYVPGLRVMLYLIVERRPMILVQPFVEYVVDLIYF